MIVVFGPFHATPEGNYLADEDEVVKHQSPPQEY